MASGGVRVGRISPTVNKHSGGRLPPVRLIAQPSLGFGLDARLRLGPGVNCFMACEAYVNGKSLVGFGIEPRHAPWLRLQLAPTFHLALRVPILRLSNLKVLHCGAQATFARDGKLASLDLSSTSNILSSLWSLVAPALEVQHRATLFEALLDDTQRSAIRKTLEDVRAARQIDNSRLQKNRERLLQSFDPPEIPPLDPRRHPSASRIRVSDATRQSDRFRQSMSLRERRHMHNGTREDDREARSHSDSRKHGDSKPASEASSPPNSSGGGFVAPPYVPRYMLGETLHVNR
jgi:hypothetical protein